MNNKNDKDKYPFINEVIKEKGPDKKKIARNIFLIVVFVIALAMVAAVVFVKMVSVMGGTIAAEQNSKVAIPEDQDPDAVTDSSVLSGQTAEGENSAGDGQEAEGQNGEDSSISTENEAEEFTTEDYEIFCRQMDDVVKEHRDSLVKIISVDSEVGYFNENYEDTQECTGLIIADNGSQLFVLADSSMVDTSAGMQVLLNNGTYVEGNLVRSDSETGLTVIGIMKSKIPASIRADIVPISLGNSYNMKEGQPVIAVGELSGFKETVSFGNITSIGNIYPYYDVQYSLFSTDIAMTGGGGFLLNLDGEVIGAITAKTVPADVKVYTGIGISEIKSLIERLSNDEEENYLGVKLEEINEATSGRTGLPEGLLVKDVENEGPAMLAGIQPMDIITEIDGNEILSYANYRTWLKNAQADSTAKVKVMRSGKDGYEETGFEVTVGSR